MCIRQLGAAIFQRALAVGRDEPFAGFDQGRQSGFRIGTDIDVHVGITAEILDVALHEKVDRGDIDDLGIAPAGDALGIRNVVDLETEGDVGLIAGPSHAGERMMGREIHPLLIFNRGL